MQNKTIEILVGLFVLLGMAALLFVALKAANLTTIGVRDTYSLKARFDNIGGLKVRAPVRAAGVAVGRVTAIALDGKSYQGVVTMEVDRDYVFPKDSSAKILTAGLLGDQYVGLEAGGDEKTLAAGETVGQTQSAVVLENLIGQFLFNKAAEAGTDTGPRCRARCCAAVRRFRRARRARAATPGSPSTARYSPSTRWWTRYCSSRWRRPTWRWCPRWSVPACPTSLATSSTPGRR